MEPYEARERAAQAWCDNSTSHLDMIPELAEAFAKILVEEVGKASPASAPEGWKWRRHARTRWEAVGHWDSIEEMAYNDMLGRGWDVEKLYSHAAPTPPVSEDRKDAERYRWLRKEWFREDEENSWFMQSESSFLESPDEFDAAIDAAMEGK